MMMLGYEDTNDVSRLQYDPLFKDVLQGDLASQPTLSRFENRYPFTGHDLEGVFHPKSERYNAESFR